METPKAYFDSLFEKVEVYATTNIELTKLKVLASSITFTIHVVKRLIVLAMVSTFLLFLNFGAALYVGDLLGQTYLGFFIVAGFYMILSIVLFFFLHRWIKKPLSNFIISHILR